MGVSEVDSASLGWDSYTAERAEGLCQGKTRAHREGSRTVEEYTCGITRRVITTHGHLALGNTRVLDLASGSPPHLTAEGTGGTSTGFAVGNWTEKQQSARIRSVEGNGAASMIDTEQVPVLLAIRDKYTGGLRLYTEMK